MASSQSETESEVTVGAGYGSVLVGARCSRRFLLLAAKTGVSDVLYTVPIITLLSTHMFHRTPQPVMVRAIKLNQIFFTFHTNRLVRICTTLDSGALKELGFPGHFITFRL